MLSIAKKKAGLIQNSIKFKQADIRTVEAGGFELEQVLKQCDFKVIQKCNPDGSRFSDKQSQRILIVAKKL